METKAEKLEFIKQFLTTHNFTMIKDYEDYDDETLSNIIAIFNGDTTTIHTLYDISTSIIYSRALGTYYKSIKDYDQAIKYYKMGEILGDIHVLNCIGACYAELEDYINADLYITKSFEKGDEYGHYNKAMMHMKRKEYANAEPYLLSAYEKNKEYRTKIEYNLFSVYMFTDNREKAVQYLQLAYDHGHKLAIEYVQSFKNLSKYN